MLSFVAILAAGYVGWATLLFLTQRRMMFPGAGVVPTAGMVDALPAGVEQVWIPFPDGRVEAWLLQPGTSVRGPAVIFAHGNAELMQDGLTEARSLLDLGLAVLLVEYPGYGRSDGRPSRGSIGDVYLAAYDWLAGRPYIDPARIVGMGRSLGGGAITDLARNRTLRALVLQSTFTSVADLARRYRVPGFLARDPFDNLTVLSTYPGPVMLIHGTWDEVIPHSNSVRLAGAAPAAELLSLECGHNDCPPDWAVYMTALQDFLVRADILRTPTE